MRADGSHYSRNDRRFYYSLDEIARTVTTGGHIAKTPLHVARWAIQAFTKKGDWVLDPTVGAGTTLVEAITHGRSAVGVEIESVEVAKANVEHVLNAPGLCEHAPKYALVHGDARKLEDHLEGLDSPSFTLVVNNPPYSGDASQKGLGKPGYEYDKTRANLAFLKEGPAYYETMQSIYAVCVKHLRKNGRFVIGVKDQMRNKTPDQLHQKLADVLAKIPKLEFEGVALLKHHPGTLHLNTYERHYGVAPPSYQTIVVFRKT